MSTAKPLAGQVAIVTGAGRNIGRAIALALAADGAKITINTRTNRADAEAVAREVAELGSAAAVVVGDVADPRTAEQLAAETMKHFGRIDILVNNAALRREAPVHSLDLAQWREVMATILDGSFLCVKAALPHMIASGGGGSIINIGGLSAHTGAKNRVHVVTAKSGLVGFTRALAHDLSGDGVTVNCVVPGLIDTARDPSAALPSHHQVNRTLVGRLGLPEEIAAAVRYLASPGARYVTGQTLHVNGGAYLP
jgi:3-oxoacyl-[acyl-carrier protein] reductase